MSQPTLPIPFDGTSPFEAIKRTDERGEWWSARELQSPLGYSIWRDFARAIDRAKMAATNTGFDVSSNFADARKISSAGPDGADYRLTRYACYLIAMNGDPRKKEIADAQTYFAVKTREAEVAAQRFGLPLTFAEALRLAADQAEEIERQGRQIGALEPRAAQADHYREADGLHAVASFANDLQLWAVEHHGVRLLHEQVRDFLGDIGLIIRGDTVRNNEPKAEAIKAGLVRPKHTTYETETRGRQSTTTARLTPKGWGYAWDRAVARIAETGSLKPSRALEMSS